MNLTEGRLEGRLGEVLALRWRALPEWRDWPGAGVAGPPGLRQLAHGGGLVGRRLPAEAVAHRMG